MESRFKTALRAIGMISIAASATVFMFQGLEALSPFQQFLSFSALTGVLATLGLVVGRKWNEAKSARVFLGLAAAATPVLFSQIGAMVYGEHAELATGAVTALATTLVMAPILYVGFGAFFRAHAKQLMLLMLAGSALLVLPLRMADLTAVLITTQVALISAYMLRSKRHAPGEVESLVAGALPVIPILVLFTRQLFYESSLFFLASLFLMIASALIVMVPYLRPQAKGLVNARLAGLISLGGAWYFTASGIGAYVPVLHDLSAMFAIYPAVIGLLYAFRRYAAEAKELRGVFAALALIIPVLSVGTAWDYQSGFLFVTIGFAVAVMGFVQRDRAVHLSGLVTSVIGLVFYGYSAAILLSAAPWISLATFGIVSILAATWLEKQRGRLAAWRKHFEPDVCPAQNL